MIRPTRFDPRRAEAYRALGDACVVFGRFAPALRAIERAARLARRVDEAWAARLEAQRLHPLVHLERYEEARVAGETAIRRFAELGDRQSHLRTLMALADLEYRLDRPGSALRLFARVDALLPEDMPPRFRAVLAANRANALEACHRYRAAERGFDAARRLFRAAGAEHSSAQVEYNAAYSQLLRGRYDAALRGYARTEEVFERLGDDRHLGLIDLERAEIHLRLHMPKEAATLAARAAERLGKAGLLKERAQATQLLGSAADLLGKHAEFKPPQPQPAVRFWDGGAQPAHVGDSAPERLVIGDRRIVEHPARHLGAGLLRQEFARLVLEALLVVGKVEVQLVSSRGRRAS